MPTVLVSLRTLILSDELLVLASLALCVTYADTHSFPTGQPSLLYVDVATLLLLAGP